MLILTRRVGETIMIGEEALVTFTVIGVKGNQVRIGINAPKDVQVHREEIYWKIKREKNEISKEMYESLSQKVNVFKEQAKERDDELYKEIKEAVNGNR